MTYKTEHLPREKDVLKTDLQWMTYFNYYANTIDGHSETWTQAVARMVDILRMLSDDKYTEDDYQEIHDGIYNHNVLPSMRLASMPKAAIERDHTVLYNCCFLPMDTFTAIAETLYLSMSGVGVGYTVERQAIENLPQIPEISDDLYFDYVVEDTQAGWADSVKYLFESIVDGVYPYFDYSELRPAGAPLKTKGGTSSGPEPLMKYHKHVLKILTQAQGRQLTSIEVHDIVNMISECAISNGSRSGALICLFDDNDVDMMNAKSDPKWYEKTPWRAYSNNSVVVNGTTHDFIDDIVNKLIYDNTGEPGLFSRTKFEKSGRIPTGIVGPNPCVTGDTLVHTVNGDIPFKTLAETEADIDVYCVDPSSKAMVIRTMHRPHKTGTESVWEIEVDHTTAVKATENHKFMNTRSEYVSVEDMDVDDSIVVYDDNIRKVGKITSIAYMGIEDVYNGMVDEVHNYLVGGQDEPTSYTTDRPVYFVSKNCGEVLLNTTPSNGDPNAGAGQFCNLSTVVLDEHSVTNSEELNRRLRIATLIGTIQSNATDFAYIRKGWKDNCDNERLLGVCVTGLYDYKECFDQYRLTAMQDYVQYCNQVYADVLGINYSTSTTSIKPSGNTSVLTNTSPGANPDFGRYQIRNVRVGMYSKMAKFLISKGVPYVADPFESTPSKYVFSFPKESNSDNTLETTTAKEQIDNYLLWEEYYTSHNVSVTITYKNNEEDFVADWIRDNYKHVSGMTFFPESPDMPYLPINVVDKRTYDQAIARHPVIDWREYYEYDGVHEQLSIAECSGERCDIVW